MLQQDKIKQVHSNENPRGIGGGDCVTDINSNNSRELLVIVDQGGDPVSISIKTQPMDHMSAENE